METYEERVNDCKKFHDENEIYKSETCELCKENCYDREQQKDLQV